MKIKKYDDLIKKFLTDEEIETINAKAKIKAQIMLSIANTVKSEMEKKQIGFNELARVLQTSPTQINKILKGDGNITIDSLINVCTALHIEPNLTFKITS